MVDDPIQETFTPLLKAGPRLDNSALAPLAVVLAGTIAVSFVRGRSTQARHRHRLVELTAPDRPQERALRQAEEHAATAQLGPGPGQAGVNYLGSIRGVDLPAARCRAVLTALSAGDRRRQRALDAGGHLLDREVCAGLSEPLTERRRALAGLLPLGWSSP